MRRPGNQRASNLVINREMISRKQPNSPRRLHPKSGQYRRIPCSLHPRQPQERCSSRPPHLRISHQRCITAKKIRRWADGSRNLRQMSRLENRLTRNSNSRTSSRSQTSPFQRGFAVTCPGHATPVGTSDPRWRATPVGAPTGGHSTRRWANRNNSSMSTRLCPVPRRSATGGRQSTTCGWSRRTCRTTAGQRRSWIVTCRRKSSRRSARSVELIAASPVFSGGLVAQSS